MNSTIINLLYIFDVDLTNELIKDASPKLITQLFSLVCWIGVILIFFPVIMSMLMWFGHMILYGLSTRYRVRQNKGSAVINLMVRIRDSSKWNDTIKSLVDKEYQKIQSEPVWYQWLIPQICTGGWDLKSKNE